MFLNKIQIQINTVLYLLKANSNIIEHTVHTYFFIYFELIELNRDPIARREIQTWVHQVVHS